MSFGYAAIIASAFFTADEQYGHSKSENSTSVIFASAGPSTGEPSTAITTGSSRSFGRRDFGEESINLLISIRLLPSLTPFTALIANALLYEQFGSASRHSAVFKPHWQEQSCSRISFSTARF